MLLWNLSVKYWAELGLGSTIALTDATLSEKIAMQDMLGKSLVRSVILDAAMERAAISASKTSACPPRPSWPVSISFPKR